MSLRQIQSRVLLWVKKSPVLQQLFERFVAHKEIALGGALVVNILVLGSLLFATARQSAYLAQQNQALNQIASLETKLETANQEASNNSGALQQLQVSVAQIAKEQSIPLLKILGATATDLSSHDLDPTQALAQDELVATGGALDTTTSTPLPNPSPTTTSVVTSPAPTPTGPTPLGIIEINASNKDGKSIYDAPDSAKIVETASPNTVMLYYQKQGGWYKVDPPTHLGIYGWVQQDNVTEIPNVTELPR